MLLRLISGIVVILLLSHMHFSEGAIPATLRNHFIARVNNDRSSQFTKTRSAIEIVGKAPAPLVAAEASIERYYDPPASSPVAILGKSFRTLIRGTKDMFINWGTARKLYRKRNREGPNSLTFSEFSFLERMKSDRSKALRIFCLLPFSPEFVFYGYLVTPLISSGNPWAWSALPSSFDCASDQRQRERVMNRRRMHTFMTALLELKSSASDDLNVQNRKRRQEQVALIDRALGKGSIEDALEELSTWFCSPELKNKKKLQKLQLKNMPGKIVKQCCRSLGVEGVPNIILVRTWNVWEMQSQLNHVRNSDRFLQAKGLDSLDANEVISFDYTLDTTSNFDFPFDFIFFCVVVSTFASTAAPSRML